MREHKEPAVTKQQADSVCNRRSERKEQRGFNETNSDDVVR